ncbi:MAG: TAXI family TRAP transporter solute-binding subunit [Rubrobacteraceae bacterium]
MTRRLILATALTLILSLVLVACGGGGDGGSGGGTGGNGGGGGETDYKKDLRMGTGSTGGVYFPLGQEMATIIPESVDMQGFNISAVSTGASVENLAKISQGGLQLGLAQNTTAFDAVNGEGEFQGNQVTNAGFMGQLYPEAVQVITRESTGVTSIDQLEGKKVAVGPPGGGTAKAARLILEAYGLEEGDYQAFEEGFDDAKAKIQDGNIDASIEVLGVPASSVQELQASTGDVVLLPVEGDARSQVVENTTYDEFEIPADSYDFLEGPVPTISAFATLFGSTTQVSPDLGYEITKALYENADQITLPQKEFITLDSALDGRGDLPLHPGAERYFKEEGILSE